MTKEQGSMLKLEIRTVLEFDKKKDWKEFQKLEGYALASVAELIIVDGVLVKNRHGNIAKKGK